MSETVRRTSLQRIVGGILATLVLSAAGALAVAAPASAAPADCGAGYSCLYSGYGYGNDWVQNSGTLRYGYCVDDLRKHWYNDIASSFFNNGRTDGAYVYRDLSRTGQSRYFARNTGSTNLSAFNDTITSAYFSSQLGNVGTARCY